MAITITDVFATDEFISDNRELFDEYIKLRVHGYPSHQSFLRVFGGEYWEGPVQGLNRVEAMEGTQYFQTKFAEMLNATEVAKLWDVKKAINGFLTIARDPMTRDSTRLAADKELNLLVGIVVVDENGKTRAGRSLEDFYKQLPAPG